MLIHRFNLKKTMIDLIPEGLDAGEQKNER
jgi:hypothetical protein